LCVLQSWRCIRRSAGLSEEGLKEGVFGGGGGEFRIMEEAESLVEGTLEFLGTPPNREEVKWRTLPSILKEKGRKILGGEKEEGSRKFADGRV